MRLLKRARFLLFLACITITFPSCTKRESGKTNNEKEQSEENARNVLSINLPVPQPNEPPSKLNPWFGLGTNCGAAVDIRKLLISTAK